MTEEEAVGRWFMQDFITHLSHDSYRLNPHEPLIGRRFRLVEVTEE